MNKLSTIGFPFVFVAGLIAVPASAQNNKPPAISVSGKAVSQGFPLVKNHQSATLYYDKNDALVVGKTVSAFQTDVKNVTGARPQIKNEKDNLSAYPVIIGTIGQSSLVDQLIKNGKLQVGKVKGKWETFGIALIKNPVAKVKQALVIYGSDRRGTAYGVFELSKMIGVSPFYWWADVEIKQQKELYISPGETIVGPPTVKYRGIFINDEDWGLQPWAAKTFDPKLGDIGPKTYAKVFELLLRIKANCIWPAMHPISGAFHKYPENKVVADSFAIVTSSAHPEPLLFNNASEWDVKTMGPWNYDTNKKGILNALNKRVKENAPYESVYTIALRGIHDAGMVGNLPMSERVKLLENAISDERKILTTHINKPIEQIPQIFIPYKEVLDIYEHGLKVPDDITLVWPDDNFGYMKKLSNADERKRSGGAGVYYHVSYLGEPHDNLWFSTTPPALMYEELKKAYDTGADRFWILNVGDIKGCEYSMQLFMDMGWNIHQFNFDNVHGHEAKWLAEIFGSRYQNELEDITDEFYKLAFVQKPEYMGGGVEWNNQKNSNEKISDTQFSFSNYNEAQNRLKAYNDLEAKAETVYNRLSESQKPSFFELIFYPIKGAKLMNYKMLLAQQNRHEAVQNFFHANYLQTQVKAYQDSLVQLTYQYNSLLNGKWNHMASLKQGYTASYFELPPTKKVTALPGAVMKVVVEGEDQAQAMASVHQLPGFSRFSKKLQYIHIYNKGGKPVKWQAKTDANWIRLSASSGETKYVDRVMVNIDWTKIPTQENITSEIDISGNGKSEKIFVNVFNPKTENLKGRYVEHNGVVAINAGAFSRKHEKDGIKITMIPNLGIENQSIQLGELTNNIQNRGDTERSKAEYDFYTFGRGSVDVYTYALPTFALDKEHNTRYGISIDNGISADATAGSQEYAQPWKDNVLRNFSVYKSTLYIDKPGKHTLQILCTDPGIVVQKIVIDLGGLKKSFLGPVAMKVE